MQCPICKYKFPILKMKNLNNGKYKCMYCNLILDDNNLKEKEMKEINEYYVIKLFCIERNEYTYLYANNPYKTIFIANRYSSYEEGFAGMQEFFQWNRQRKDFDMSKSKVVKIILTIED